MEEVKVKKEDIGEYTHVGFECPKCGDWIQRSTIGDIDVCDNEECGVGFRVV